MLVLILFVVLLLWPDISEITVLGVTLKRRVAAAESVAKEAKAEVASLNIAFQIQQVRIESMVAASASASVTNHNHLGPVQDWDQNTAEMIRALYEQIIKEHSAKPGPNSADPEGNLSEEQLKLRLLADFEVFATMLGLRRQSTWTNSPQEVRRQKAVQRDFSEENFAAIQSIRALRNAVAHSRNVSTDEVIEGLTVLADLIPRLQTLYEDLDVREPTAEDE